MRRSTCGASSIVPHSGAEKVDERGDDAEAGEEPGQHVAGVEEVIETVADAESKADGDGKHPPDRGGLEELGVAALFVLIVRHEASRRPSRRSSARTRPPG